MLEHLKEGHWEVGGGNKPQWWVPVRPQSSMTGDVS